MAKDSKSVIGAIDALESTLRRGVEGLERMENSRRSTLKYSMYAVLWFALPFLSMWSLGVSPETAARASVFPFLAYALSGALMLWAARSFIVGMMESAAELIEAIAVERETR